MEPVEESKPKRRKIVVHFTGGQLLGASSIVFFVNTLMFVAIIFHSRDGFTTAIFSSGWLFSPLIGYVAFREMTEGRKDWRFLFAGVISTLGFIIWLTSAGLVTYLKTQNIY